MNRLWKVLGIAGALVLLVVITIAVLSAIGESRFRQLYQQEKESLLTQGRSAPSAQDESAAAAALPPPVRKYLEISNARGESRVKTAILMQHGALKPAADKPEMPFEAEQTFSVDPPGFTWLCQARLAPGLSMWVRDKFIDGRGNMLVRLLGLFSVADAAGPGIDQGAGLRFLGEILAFPSAVLSPYLKWQSMDERRCRVSMQLQGLQMDGVVEFSEAGGLAAFHADRYMEVNGTSILTPWSGFLSQWKSFEGRRFPGHWEAVWHLKEGDLTYVRIDILRVTTD
jgi:hypothetical protein